MAGTSTSVYEFDSVVRGQHINKSVWTSLTDWCSKTHKCILVWEDKECDKDAINDQLETSEREMQTSREISRISLFSLTFGTILRFIKFNNFDTRHLNGPRLLFLSFCCTTHHIFEPLHVFEPGFNMDKYGMCKLPPVVVAFFVCAHINSTFLGHDWLLFILISLPYGWL